MIHDLILLPKLEKMIKSSNIFNILLLFEKSTKKSSKTAGTVFELYK